MNTDFQIKLKEALSKSNFVVPPGIFLDQVENELDYKFKEPSYSPVELSKMITSQSCQSLVSTHTFTKLKLFMQFVEREYTEFKGGNAGMSDYMKEYKIDTWFRAFLVNKGFLIAKGLRTSRTYKWSGKKITDEAVYEIALEFKTRKKESNNESRKFTPEQEHFIKTAVRAGKTLDQVKKESTSILKDKTDRSIAYKYNQLKKKYLTPSKGDIVSSTITKGHIPSSNAKLQKHLLPHTYTRTYHLPELIVIYFMLYHGFSNAEIGEAIGRTSNMIAQKKNTLKTTGKLTPTYTTRFLSNNNQLLNELFIDEIKEPEKPEEKQQEIEFNEEKPKENTENLDLVPDIESRYIMRKLSKLEVKNKKNKKEIRYLKNQVESLEKLVYKILKLG